MEDYSQELQTERGHSFEQMMAAAAAAAVVSAHSDCYCYKLAHFDCYYYTLAPFEQTVATAGIVVGIEIRKIHH